MYTAGFSGLPRGVAMSSEICVPGRQALAKRLAVFASLVLAALLSACVAAPQQALADTTETVSVNVKYCQTEARSMLSMVNAFRTGDDAWYWNEDDTTKTTCTNLKEYKYDYTLEKVAMQRAAETAIYWTHARPNGDSDPWSAYTDSGCSYSSAGENIAYNSSSDPEYAFTQWKEENDKYSGQGHRRAMLSSDFTTIGIGCVYYNNRYFWVQDFNSKTNSLTETTANNSNTDVDVEVSYELITVTTTPSLDSVSVYEGASTDVPSLTTKISTSKSKAGAVPVTAKYAWAVSDASVATLSGSTLTGKSKGSTNLTTTVLGKSVSVPVTVQGDISKATVSVGSATYIGSALTPSVTVKSGSTTLTEDTDYTVAYSNNTNAGAGTVTVTGKGDYAGTKTATFTINPAAISFASINAIAAQTYTGSALAPTITVKNGSTTLKKDTDYTVSYSNNTNAGTATATITGKGNYTGTKSAEFTINKADISSASIASIAAQTYTGSAIKPAVTVTLNGKTLASSTDYTVAYSNNTNAGTATVSVTGTGNYAGTTTAKFTINKAASSISLADQTLTYNGSAQAYSGKVTKSGSSGAVTYKYYSDSACKTSVAASNVKNVGTYYVKATVAADSNYSEATSAAAQLTINKMSISSGGIASIADQTYTGSAIEPAVTVILNGKTLADGADYEVSYGSNTNAGTATVTVTGNGNYSGTLNSTFKINKATPSVTAAAQTLAYNGSAQTYSGNVDKGGSTGEVTYAYYSDEACKTSVSEVKNVGTYYVKVMVAVDSNYNAATSAAAKFIVSPADISKVSIGSIDDQTYTGSAFEPEVTVKDGSITLTKDADYTVSYSGNTNAGTAKVTVNGQGNYTGTKTATFAIKPLSISEAKIGDIASQTCTGSAIKPAVAVILNGTALVNGMDYTVAYSGNTNVGTATVTVTGKGNYSGSLKGSFTITKGKSSISLADQGKTYTGKLLAYSGTAKVTGSAGAVTYAYYADAACTQLIKSTGVLNAGTYYVKATVAGDANCDGATSAAAKFTIAKAANPAKVKASTKTVKYSKAKKKAQKVTSLKVTNAQGKVTYKKSSGNKKLTVDKKTGKVTVKKGTKKGTYKIKVKVSAAGNNNYNAFSKTVTIKVKVK